MLKFLLLASVILCVLSAVQIARAPLGDGARVLWIALVIIAPIAGPIIWLTVGRPRAAAAQSRP